MVSTESAAAAWRTRRFPGGAGGVRRDRPRRGGGRRLGQGATAVEEVVVTAQRKSEVSQTVPISISAFSEKTLEKQKIEGGPDLLKAIPNVSFTKTNFSGYNLTIRGIGTQAVSVTTDPGVSVNFNGTALIRNRLFEQEFFDVEQVEVLRGPQGTLYGRNATAGAVNVISAKPIGEFAGQVKGELGTYGDTRLSGFLNLPIAEDKLAVRFAGSYTKRDGYRLQLDHRQQHRRPRSLFVPHHRAVQAQRPDQGRVRLGAFQRGRQPQPQHQAAVHARSGPFERRRRRVIH